MTKKRFEINNLVKKGNMSFWDNENKSILNASHTLDLLNNLSEENDELKQTVSDWSGSYDELFEDRDVWMHKCHVLEKENEQLKQRINSRLHFYRELYESTNDNVVKRVIEDLEDILK